MRSSRTAQIAQEHAVQVAFYAALLAGDHSGRSDIAFAAGRDRRPVGYDLVAPWNRSGRSIERITSELVDLARALRHEGATTRGALSAVCKTCRRHALRKRELVAQDDLTLPAGSVVRPGTRCSRPRRPSASRPTWSCPPPRRGGRRTGWSASAPAPA